MRFDPLQDCVIDGSSLLVGSLSGFGLRVGLGQGLFLLERRRSIWLFELLLLDEFEHLLLVERLVSILIDLVENRQHQSFVNLLHSLDFFDVVGDKRRGYLEAH